MPNASGLGVRFRALTSGRIGLATDKQMIAVEKFMYAWLNNIVEKVQPYPPIPPPPNRYQRTNDLFRAWTLPVSVVQNPSGFVGRVAVDPSKLKRPYAKYVLGLEQRPYHAAHGWKRIHDYEDHPAFTAGVLKIMRSFRVTKLGGV